MAVNKPHASEIIGKKGPIFSDADFALTHPALHGYLSDNQYASGEPRLTATLTIFVDGGVLKCCVNDRDNNRSGFVEAPTWMGLLMQIEINLSEDVMEWKVKGGYNKQANKPPF